MAYDGLIISFLGQGLAAARPAAPNIDPDAIALYWSTDASPGLELSVWAGAAWHAPSGFIASAIAMTASEAFSGGEFCNIHASSGAKIRKANATDDTKPVNGFVASAITSGAAGLMAVPGSRLTGLSGLTPGVPYYLDTTAGAITATPPSGSGNLVQEVGIALSATELLFNPKLGVTL